MYQGTTPTIRFSIDGYDLTEAQVYLTLRKKYTELMTWTNGDEGFNVFLDEEAEDTTTIIQVELTQEETLGFPKGKVAAQVRWIDAEGHAWATEKADLSVDDVLLPGEIDYRRN